jgi:hypothetical protein
VLELGGRPQGYTLDRIDPTGNYEAGNLVGHHHRPRLTIAAVMRHR